MPKWSEKEFINWVDKLVNKSDNLLGHEEDAVATQLKDEILVVNIDGWVASTDRPEGMTLKSCGYRAVANAISDVIAKGAIPEGMVISLSISPDQIDNVKEIVAGFSHASDSFDVPYLGGDLNQANDIVIDVTVWGRTKNLVKRSGASVNERVCWLGPPLGENTAAFGILTKKWKGSSERSLTILSNPSLFPEFVGIGATASVDSSDGIAKSLYLLANASKVGIKLDGTFPINKWVKEVAMENDKSIIDLLFYGGEELGIVFTYPISKPVPKNCIELGHTFEGSGVWLDDEMLENRGWEHFESSD